MSRPLQPDSCLRVLLRKVGPRSESWPVFSDSLMIKNDVNNSVLLSWRSHRQKKLQKTISTRFLNPPFIPKDLRPRWRGVHHNGHPARPHRGAARPPHRRGAGRHHRRAGRGRQRHHGLWWVLRDDDERALKLMDFDEFCQMMMSTPSN